MSDKSKKNPSRSVELVQFAMKSIVVGVRGTAPYIANRIPPEVIETLEAGQGGAQVPKRPIRDSMEEFRRACYLLPGSSWEDERPRFGIPSAAFKAAMIDAGKEFGVDKVKSRLCIQVSGEDCVELVTLNCKSVSKYTKGLPLDGKLHVRHRAKFDDWKATLVIRYSPLKLDLKKMLNILAYSGVGGVGDERPNGKKCSGVMGTYEIDPSVKVQEIS